MNSSPPLAARASHVLVEDAQNASPRTDSDRARTVELIAAAMRTKANRRRRMRLGFAAVAAAAVSLLGVAGWQAHGVRSDSLAARPPAATPTATAVARSIEGSVLVMSGGRTDRLTEGRPVKVGDRVIALQDGHASLTLPSGTRITVEGGGDLALLEQGQTQLLGVSAGAVRADVTKLQPGERFIIRTSDAEVEVRGTSFRVAQAPADASCGAGTTTRVIVYEGVVMVRAASTESSVGAGEVWPRGCGVKTATPLSSAPAARPSPLPFRVPDRSREASMIPSSPPPWATSATMGAPPLARPESEGARSQLAAQNDLFDEAMASKRSGDFSAALAGFERFLARYPSSPLAENAAAERMRLLGSMGGSTNRARAVAAAKDYVARYPAGFAKADAEAILGKN